MSDYERECCFRCAETILPLRDYWEIVELGDAIHVAVEKWLSERSGSHARKSQTDGSATASRPESRAEDTTR
jgi:hypothetical protein